MTPEDKTGTQRSSLELEKSAARVLVWFASFSCLFNAAVAFQWGFALPWKILPLLGAALSLASLRLAPPVQLRVSTCILSTILALYCVELCLSVEETAPGSAAVAAGRPFDSRTPDEVIRDLRTQGVDAYPDVLPAAVYPRKPQGIPILGRNVLPLAGISNHTIVHCNESGKYALFPSDEHGFNNPKGIWTQSSLDLAVLGDSYAEGYCVKPEDNLVAHLRRRYPATLNLGMGGSGPLLELAQLLEYLPPLHPRTVLWLFFENDMDDLREESRIPILKRYLDPAFRQGLAGDQAAIDDGIRRLVEEIAPTASRWPPWLDSIGLPRTRCPLWIQDLIMAEDSTTAMRVLRLRSVYLIVKTVWHGVRARGQAGAIEDLLRQILQEARAAVSAWGGKFYLVYVPSYAQVRSKGKLPVRKAILDLCASIGIPALDLYPAFAAHPHPLSLFPYPRAHYSEEGYGVAARWILLYLDQEHSKRTGEEILPEAPQ